MAVGQADGFGAGGCELMAFSGGGMSELEGQTFNSSWPSNERICPIRKEFSLTEPDDEDNVNNGTENDLVSDAEGISESVLSVLIEIGLKSGDPSGEMFSFVSIDTEESDMN